MIVILCIDEKSLTDSQGYANNVCLYIKQYKDKFRDVYEYFWFY